VARVPRKSVDDLALEKRIRAHLRQQMEDRAITPTELARRIGADDGNITRILSGERGIKSLGQVWRICDGLKITPTRLLTEDPPSKYWDDEWDKNH
jgi:transcriptional regulator with XRE-family HTH domain